MYIYISFLHRNNKIFSAWAACSLTNSFLLCVKIINDKINVFWCKFVNGMKIKGWKQKREKLWAKDENKLKEILMTEFQHAKILFVKSFKLLCVRTKVFLCSEFLTVFFFAATAFWRIFVLLLVLHNFFYLYSW
jgi:hypothetical protein